MAAEKRPCPKCGASNYATDRQCLSCGADLAAPKAPPPPPPTPQYAPAPPGPSPTTSSGFDAIIPVKNTNALAAYYLGLFSLVPFIGLPMGITALVLGLKGRQFARENPGVHGTTHSWVGIICGGFWALVNVFILIAVISAVVVNG